MAETKPNKNDLSIPTISTDANGWTCYDYGTHKQYRKKGTVTESLTASQWKWSANSISLPVGMANTGACFSEAACVPSDTAITVQPNLYGGTSINFAITNQFGGAVNNFTIYYSFCLTTSS